MRDTGAVPRFALACDTLNCVVLFLVIVVSCSYFFTGGGWNQASRFDLVRAIIDKGTLAIDDYGGNTEDKAEWNGHYYSDKAPGTALLAVPFVAVAKQVARKLTDDQKTILMAIISVSLTLVAMATHPMTPPVEWPLREIFFPGINEAHLSQNEYGLFNSGATPAVNLGELAGLHGLLSLVPLLLFWYSAAKVWNRIQYGRRLRVTWFDAPEATRSLPGRIAEPSHRNEPLLLRCDWCDRRRLDSVRGQRTIVSTRRG